MIRVDWGGRFNEVFDDVRRAVIRILHLKFAEYLYKHAGTVVCLHALFFVVDVVLVGAVGEGGGSLGCYT